MSGEIMVEGIKNHNFTSGFHAGYGIFFSDDTLFVIRNEYMGLQIIPAYLRAQASEMLYDEDKIQRMKCNSDELKKESEIIFKKTEVTEIILQKPTDNHPGYFRISSTSDKTVKITFLIDQYSKVKFLFQKYFPEILRIRE
jgi:hypothetical protein